MGELGKILIIFLCLKGKKILVLLLIMDMTAYMVIEV